MRELRNNQNANRAAEKPASRDQIGIEPGLAHPLGAVPDEEGINFSIFADHATAVELLLFDGHDDPEPIQTIQLDPSKNKTFNFWYVYLRGLKSGIHYAYRVDGSTDLHGRGDRYNRNKVLVDPYARGENLKLRNSFLVAKCRTSSTAY